MSKTDAASANMPTNAAQAKRRLHRLVLDWIFLYGITAAAILLGFRSIYVFLTSSWTLAEGLATGAKLLGIIAITYFIRTRYAK